MTKDPALARFGKAVRARRRAAGLSQEGLAERSDLHRNYVGGVERGERNLGYMNVLALARGLGCPPAALVADAEGPVEPPPEPAPGSVREPPRERFLIL